jgi:hypothetical protein
MPVTGYVLYSTTIVAWLCVHLLLKFSMAGLFSYILIGLLLQEWCLSDVISIQS